METENLALAVVVLAAARGLVDGIDARTRAAGFDDLRPAHGFVFARIAAGDAGISELAAHMGVTKQAASQLVDELSRKGYVRREPDPRDGRAKIVTLTARGVAATRAADQAAAELVGQWRQTLGAEAVGTLLDSLGRVAPAGRLRPIW
ncbi:DNA-binding MarR family transcriptional regulator [Stackebrandtia albiflava]|uniref:DNA-binding MarR family transcriptional regulator n=1 Tax=Stackebrandtia albiflava TaxID=406432 RepID=A0A562VAF7_9ACTN|nr:MarR family transcriptional regulator [Stackebrandtia albiflava]TWJ14831.1 DNA-binding MarR family transcriptional regulator [Stackebrandtia albiflava]